MTNTLRRWRLLALICACAQPVFATSYSGTSAFSFLNIPVGARATAMGEAFSSVPNDVQGLVYNPASLATLVANQVSFEHLSYVSDVNQEAVAFGHAGHEKGISWGVSANYLQVSNIVRTVASLQGSGDGFTEVGSFSTYDANVGLAAARPVTENLLLGSTIKLIRESLSDASSNAGALDLGAIYEANEQRSLDLSVVMQNLGFASRFADAAVELPWTLRIGMSGQPFAQWLFSADYVKRRDLSGQFNVGGEVTPQKFISLRLGYEYQLTRPDLGGISGFTGGIGLHLHMMSLDYAFVPLGDLGTTHRISLNFRFKPHRN